MEKGQSDMKTYTSPLCIMVVEFSFSKTIKEA